MFKIIQIQIIRIIRTFDRECNKCNKRFGNLPKLKHIDY